MSFDRITYEEVPYSKVESMSQSELMHLCDELRHKNLDFVLTVEFPRDLRRSSRDKTLDEVSLDDLSVDRGVCVLAHKIIIRGVGSQRVLKKV